MNKRRMILKKELRAFVKSNSKFDEGIYNDLVYEIKNIGFTDREIGYLIFYILYGYQYQKNDYELKIADFLFNQTTIKSHPRFNDLFINSFLNDSIATFELLLRNNVIIEEAIIEIIENYWENIELGFYNNSSDEIKDFGNRINTLKQYTRKQKIEKILRNRSNKSKLLHDLIINPLLLSKTTCN